ncbi:hypothetical protein JL722_2504 [Aureococcus anophagefferens]|nr:hypothetical protein JL722_2504 [Aureococcus anophagefferens]
MNVQKRRSVDGGPGKPKSTLAAMQDIEKKRQERRQQMEERKADKRAEEKRNAEQGLLGDADFVKMIGAWREARPTGAPHVPFDCGDVATAGSGNEICICVRKRPIGRREVAANDHDAVSCVHPAVVVHDCRHRVDGITKYLNNTQFAFDHAFSEAVETEEVYACVGAPLVDFVDRAAYAVFTALGNAGGVNVGVSFFEIYGGGARTCCGTGRLQVREDGKGEVNVVGLSEAAAPSPEALLETIREGNELRTKQRTEMNDASSRSHAICSICLREKASGKLLGKLSLVDLAGSERGQDTRSHNRQLRTESAEINKSLLALKECIRAWRRARTCPSAPAASAAARRSLGAGAPGRADDAPRGAPPAAARRGAPPPTDAKFATRAGQGAAARDEAKDDVKAGPDDPRPAALHRTVDSLFEEEEALLNAHMNVIQENAELLTEEGRMLQQVQGGDVPDYDIDTYVSRLQAILDRKAEQIATLQAQLHKFAKKLREEEDQSQRVHQMPMW